MPGLVYSIYAVTILLVAVGGMLGVVFGTPDLESDYRYEVLTVVACLFMLALVGGFLM